MVLRPPSTAIRPARRRPNASSWPTLETVKDRAAGKITLIGKRFGFRAAILGALIASWIR